jgi:hypothetical protein
VFHYVFVFRCCVVVRAPTLPLRSFRSDVSSDRSRFGDALFQGILLTLFGSVCCSDGAGAVGDRHLVFRLVDATDGWTVRTLDRLVSRHLPAYAVPATACLPPFSLPAVPPACLPRLPAIRCLLYIAGRWFTTAFCCHAVTLYTCLRRVGNGCVRRVTTIPPPACTCLRPHMHGTGSRYALPATCTAAMPAVAHMAYCLLYACSFYALRTVWGSLPAHASLPERCIRVW